MTSALPTTVERYVRTVYGRTNDRADWARRVALVLLAGAEPTELMPRARTSDSSDRRLDALRAVVARADAAPTPVPALFEL